MKYMTTLQDCITHKENLQEQIHFLKEELRNLKTSVEYVDLRIKQHDYDNRYDKLKAAHRAGKRIALKTNDPENNGWQIMTIDPSWNCPVDHYKIVMDDEQVIFKRNVFGICHKTLYTKDGFTGDITVRIMGADEPADGIRCVHGNQYLLKD